MDELYISCPVCRSNKQKGLISDANKLIFLSCFICGHVARKGGMTIYDAHNIWIQELSDMKEVNNNTKITYESLENRCEDTGIQQYKLFHEIKSNLLTLLGYIYIEQKNKYDNLKNIIQTQFNKLFKVQEDIIKKDGS